MTAELKDTRARFMMLLTSESWARPSLVPDVPRGDFHIRWLGGLATKFASEIRVRALNFATKNIGEEYPKLCPLNFRYDPKICEEDLHEFSSALCSLVRFKVTSKQIMQDSLSLDYVPLFASCGTRPSQAFPLIW